MNETSKRREITRFLLSGALAAVVNWLSRILYSQWLDYSFAVILAYLTGMVTAYLLFRLFVFGPGQHSVRRSVAYYTLVNGFGLLLTWGVSVGLGLHLFPYMEFEFYPLEIAHALGVAAPTFSSYFGHKFLTFRRA